jgi:hypothetical protein
MPVAVGGVKRSLPGNEVRVNLDLLDQRRFSFTTSAGQLLDLAEDALVQGVRESRPIHLLAISAASNVTGEILPVAKPARLCSCQVFDQHF